MFQLLSASIDTAVNLLGILGYLGVFFISLLDRLTVFFIPAEIVLPAFGILISRGSFNFWTVMALVTSGNFLGNLALYFIFLKGGRPFLEKYGKYLLISKHDLNHLDKLFLKYGNKIVFWGYFIPSAGRSIVPIPAGISKMNISRFSVYTLLGSIPLNFLYVYLGIKAGDNLGHIFTYLDRFNYFFIGTFIVLIMWYIYRHKIQKHFTHDKLLN